MRRFAIYALVLVGILAGTYFYLTRQRQPSEEDGPVFAPLAVRVMDAVSQKPLAGVKLYAARMGTNNFYITDAQGTVTVMAYMLEGQPAGDFDVFAKGYEKQILRICSNNPTVLMKKAGS